MPRPVGTPPPAPAAPVARSRPPRRRASRYRLRHPRRLFGLLALCAAAITLAYWAGTGLPATLQARRAAAAATPAAEKAPIWVLVLGVDQRPGDPGRADALVLTRIDQALGTVQVLSLPREIRAEIPGRGTDRLYNAYAYGGARLTLQTVSRLMGVAVPYYVQLNLEGFRRLIDQLGGINLDVERRMYYQDPQQNLTINLVPGPQRLTGEQALQYVRFRLSADGRHDDEWRRTQRQQRFVKALLAQALAPANWPRTSELLRRAHNLVQTNIPATAQKDLALTLYQARNKILHGIVPGQAAEIAGARYYLVDQAATDELLKSWNNQVAPS